MLHHTPLIVTIVGGIVLAFILGALAQRVRVSPLVGYLLAGVLVDPSTPGFVADPALAGDFVMGENEIARRMAERSLGRPAAIPESEREPAPS